jgi:hypothetical protein
MTKRITPTDMAVGRLLGCEPAAKPALDPGNPLHRALLRLERAVETLLVFLDVLDKMS